MDIKIILQDFAYHLKDEIKRIIVYTVLILFFGFIISYNIFRMNFGLNEASSWYFGSLTSVLSTLIIVVVINVIWFISKIR